MRVLSTTIGAFPFQHPEEALAGRIVSTAEAGLGRGILILIVAGFQLRQRLPPIPARPTPASLQARISSQEDARDRRHQCIGSNDDPRSLEPAGNATCIKCQFGHVRP